MDFNDISSRLKRTAKAMAGRYDDDIAVFATVEQNKWSYSVGNGDVDEIINKIFIILYNLASLKDNLKVSLKKQGHNPQIVEDEINQSLHLQILIDLVNQEKHGYPLGKKSRSGKNPLITCPMQVLRVSSGPTPNSVASIRFDGSEVHVEGNSTMVIRAGIVDDQNNGIFMLDELVDTCYGNFEKLAVKYNVIHSQQTSDF